MIFVTDGLITRVCEVGAGDKMLTLITPERGRVGVMVKGSKSPNSKLSAISQLFTYGNYEFYEKNGMFWLRGGEINKSFYDLTKNISMLSLANYLCDIANELTDEDAECEEILRLTLNSLHLLSNGLKSEMQIKAVYEMRAATISGYLPELFGCAYCHGLEEMNYLDVMGGKLICSSCLVKRGMKKVPISADMDADRQAGVLCGLSPSAATALRYIAEAPDKKLFAFELKDEEDLRALGKATEAYLLNHLGRGFDSLDFYKMVM